MEELSTRTTAEPARAEIAADISDAADSLSACAFKETTAVLSDAAANAENSILLLSSMTALLSGVRIKPENILTKDLSAVSDEDHAFAPENSLSARQTAHIVLEDGKLFCYAGPALIALSHPLSSVGNDFSSVYLSGSVAGDLMFSGRGNDAFSTGGAVAEAITRVLEEIAENASAAPSGCCPEKPAVCFGTGSSVFYLRMTAENKADVPDNITDVFSRYGICARSLTVRDPNPPAASRVRLFCILQKTERLILNKALQELIDRQYIESADTILPVYGI